MFGQIGLVMALGFASLLAAGQARSRPELHAQREAPSDLEIAGLITGVPAGESRYVSRTYLEGLPQVTLSIDEGHDFKGTGSKLRVKGIYLDALAKSLGAEEEATAAAAVCYDGYTSPFPADYIRRHKPLLVLTIDGMSPEDWAAKNHRFDAGPYFVGYEHFEPSFHILAHAEWAQEPDGMTKLIVTKDERLFAGTLPSQPEAAANADVLNGSKIARENCFRCHNADSTGGTKAGVSWKQIGAIARQKPEHFMSWVHDPKSMKARATMPANRGYDKATLTALQRYFEEFAVEGQ